jgi:hypothetical protein
MQNSPTSTLLFHLSNDLKPSIEPTSETRPAFYWFNDSYSSHIPGSTPAYKYLYFFIVKPNNGTKLFTRHGNGDFNSLWRDYQSYLKARKINPDKYNEPGVVFSFNRLVPAVIGKFIDGFNIDASRTDNDLRASFSLGKPDTFTRFSDIPELVKLLPELLQAVPLSMPSKNLDEFWSADHKNEGRMWL